MLLFEANLVLILFKLKKLINFITDTKYNPEK